jgi:hypothetical protein
VGSKTIEVPSTAIAAPEASILPRSVNYAWDTPQPFEPCSTECGTSAWTQHRQVICGGSDGRSAESDDMCTTGRPESSLKCAATRACVAGLEVREDCVGQWTDGPCSVSCGAGAVESTFVVSRGPANGGRECPISPQSRACTETFGCGTEDRPERPKSSGAYSRSPTSLGCPDGIYRAAICTMLVAMALWLWRCA